MSNRTALRMRVLPRFPARITATNGLEVVQDNLDLVIRPDFGSLVQVPSVSNPTTTFFWGWDQSLDSYSSISFQNLVENIQDVIIGENLAGIAALTVSANQVPYFLDVDGTASTYTVSSFVRGISDAADAEEFLDAIGGIPAASGFVRYSTRAAAVADVIPAPVTAIAVQQGDLMLFFKRDAGGTALTTAGGVTWSPLGDVYPDHFAENVTPGTTDMLAAISGALALKRMTHFLATTYAVTDTIVWDNGYKARGAGAHWKSRTGYLPTQGNPTILKYIGAGGSNSAVVRVSRKAVGVVGTTFTPPNGDDLVDFSIHDIHVDANNLAEFGWYIYRAGNNKSIGSLTAEKAKKRDFIVLGCYAAHWGHFGAYESESHGVSIGEDYFGWNSVESTCFEFHASFHLKNNGTADTYVKGTGTDLEESGGIFTIGRGSVVGICSEGNTGRALIILPKAQANSTDGPVIYNLTYLEGNGDGPYYRSYPGARGHVLRSGFIHPGNAASPGSDRFTGSLQPQDITIRSFTNAGVSSADQGPTDEKQWPILEGLLGDNQNVSFGIDSDTYKYKVRDCNDGIVYISKKPTPEGMFASGRITLNNPVASVWLKGCTVQQQAVGRYRIFHDCPDSLYTAAARWMSGTTLATRTVFTGGFNAGFFDIFVFDNTGTLSNAAGFDVQFEVSRIGSNRA